MGLFAKLFIAIVALLHLGFLYMEMFGWTTRAPKIFKGFKPQFFEDSKTLAANQGLYNGFLAAGLFWSLAISDPQWQHNVAVFFLACVSVAGIYGAATVSRRIFFVQAIPALVAMLLVLFG